MSGSSPLYRLNVNLRIPSNIPVFPQSVEKEVRGAFTEVYDGLNNLARALVTEAGAAPRNYSEWAALAGSPSTVLASNVNRFYLYAAENLDYGDIISLTQSGGQIQARRANAVSNAKPADGFVSTTEGIPVGTVGEVILAHGVLPASGLTVAQRYYLSTTDGIMANAPATAAGNIEQYLGVALSPEALYFNSGYWIQH